MDAAEFERKYGAEVKEKMLEDFMLIGEGMGGWSLRSWAGSSTGSSSRDPDRREMPVCLSLQGRMHIKPTGLLPMDVSGSWACEGFRDGRF
jgi:hypothetical protein